jgi:DNA polymerase III sliding clamp (beta) subunit (PCNA family)
MRLEGIRHMADEIGMIDITMNCRKLGQLLKNGIVAAGDDASRPLLATLRFEIKEHEIRVIGTNSYVMLVQTMAYSEGVLTCGEFQLDVRDAKMWSKTLLAREVANLEVRLTVDEFGKLAKMSTYGTVLSSAPVEGTYPKWENLLQDTGDYTHELTGLSSANLAKLDKIDRLDGTKDTNRLWKCENLSNSKASVWTMVWDEWDAMMLVMPVRIN